MVKMHFNFKDVFRAPRLAFAAKKIWIHFLGLILGFGVYSILCYIAAAVAGRSIGEVWASFGPVPAPFMVTLPLVSRILVIFGMLLGIVVYLLAATMVARVTFEQLRGNDFYSLKEAKGYLAKYWKGVVAAPITILVMGIGLVVCGLVIGAFGLIPVVGELGVTVLGIPILAVALFVVFLAVVFFFSLLLAPAVVGTTKSDTFETIFELFSTVVSQPWRLVVYQGILYALSQVSVLVLGWFTFRAAALSRFTLAVLMKDKLVHIWDNAMAYAPQVPRLMGFVTRSVAQYLPPGSLAAQWANYLARTPHQMRVVQHELSWSGDVSAFLLGVAFIAAVLFVVSYGLSTFSVGQSIIYVILRQKKDDQNLLEEKEIEEFPEFEEEEEGAEEPAPEPAEAEEADAGVGVPTEEEPEAETPTEEETPPGL
jgi:hypothetical protein